MTTFKIAVSLLACMVIAVFTVCAQEQPLSLKDAWNMAATNYPGIRSKKAGIQEAAYQQKITRSGRLPQVNLQFQNTYGTYNGSNGAFFPQPGFFNVNGNPDAYSGDKLTANTFGSVVANWNLYSFGRQQKDDNAAALKVSYARQDMAAYQLELKTKVTRLYFEVLYNQAKSGWATKNAVRIKQLLDLSVSLADAGLKPGADTLLAASSYLQLLSDENDWKGRWTASSYQLAAYTAADVMDAVLPAAAWLHTADIPKQAGSMASGHPYLELINQDIRYHEAHSQALGRATYPALSLLGGVGERGTGIGKNGVVAGNWSDGFKNGATNYLAGLGITWNLTGIYSNTLQKKKALQQADAAKARYDQEVLQLSTALQATSARMAEQVQQVSKTAASVQKVEEAFNLYLSRYESGLINLTELLQLQLLLQHAENSHIAACHEYWQQQITNAELTTDFSYLSERF